MKRDLSDEQIQTVKKALDDAIKEGPWDESSFLRVIRKNLQDILDTFLTDVGYQSSTTDGNESHLAHRVALRSNQKEIFISLYTSTGTQLSSWERLLANLAKHIISRPIYAEEDAVQKLVRGKENSLNEAYVAVYIDKNDILDLPTERLSNDKYGTPLLALKDRTILPDNITRFVHQNKVYRYAKGRLILQEST